MPAAARQTDNVLHQNPHCHAPIHPNAPVAHPAIPHAIISACAVMVKIDGLAAAVVGSVSKPCTTPPCVPNGPGIVSKGSATVMIESRPAARASDMVAFAGCVAPIGSPTGKILPPCSPTVMIGG